MHRNVIETVMGAVVLAVAVFFLVFAYSSADLRTVSGYELVAKFDRIDGLAVGSDVRVSGVKVGSVTSMTLDPETYLADVRMTIDPDVHLPFDTVAVVTSESLLGGKFMALQPGGDPDTLRPGDLIQYTQSTPGLEQLLGQVIFSLQQGTDKDDGAGAPTTGSEPAPGGLMGD